MRPPSLMPPHHARRDAWLLALCALLLLGTGIGLRDPWPADEPRFALVARQMIESGDWLFTRRGDELYSDKPPMLMWLQAAAYMLVREWRVAFLLPSLLSALGCLWLVHDLGRRLWTRQVGLYAAWALLLTLHFAWQMRKAQIDPLVTFWITLANYGLLRHLLHKPDARMWALGWFAAGLGTITKGVGALALLMLLPAAWAAWARWGQVREALRTPRLWLGPVAFVAAVSLWLVPMVATVLASGTAEQHAYMQDILFRQTAGRYTDSWDHPQPWWYFAEVMATRWMPLLLLLPWAIPAWRRRLRRRDPRYLLPLAWWALVVVFFSLSLGKRDVYVLPALPMVCLAFAPLLPGLLRRRGPRRLALAFTVVLGVAALAAGIALWTGDSALEARWVAQRGIEAGAGAAAALLVAIGCWVLGCLAWWGRRRVVTAMAASLVGAFVLFGLVGHPLLDRGTSGANVMQAAARVLPPDAQLGAVAWREQLLLRSDRPITTFGYLVPWDEQLRTARAWQQAAPARRWLLVQEPALGACIDRTSAHHLGISNRRSFWLVPDAAVTGTCR